MSEITITKIKNYLIVFLVLSLGITWYSLDEKNKLLERNFEIFLNHFYHEIDRTIYFAKTLTEEKKEQNVDYELANLKFSLQKLDNYLWAGSSFVNREIYYGFYFEQMQFMINGLHLTVNNRDPIEVAPFGEDGLIDDDEKLYLTLLIKDLEEIGTGLADETGNQVNYRMSMKQFNDVLMPVVTKATPEMVNKFRYEKNKRN